MKTNVGTADRWIRIIIGLALFGFFFTEPPLQYLGFVGIIPLLTAFLKWCPLYNLFGINTCPVDKK
ncbi:MAG: DUF2892 domain-containing protein [Bacillaceae bacterium]|nr:DUF2892 domain-containing protein [Bacillaceae bacterium]